MAANQHSHIPILTDIIPADDSRADVDISALQADTMLDWQALDRDAADHAAGAADHAAADADDAHDSAPKPGNAAPAAKTAPSAGADSPLDTETLIAELQTRIASETFALTEELMRTAFAEMEAKLHQQISACLRRELPELIDSLLREQLGGSRDL
jgi:hypothetical protein